MRFKLWIETNEVIMPKLFEKIKQLKSEYSGVHFSQTNQISFNINPSHHDPIGIYVFPKDYILSGHLKANKSFASYSYAFLIEPTSQAKILNLNMDYNQAEQLLVQMGIDKQLLYSTDVYHRGNKNTPGHKFWGAIEYIRNIQKMAKNISWNILFSKTGHNVIYDPGLGIIHSNEPSQIVYLDHKAYKIVDVFENTNPYSILIQFAKYFPDFKIYKKRSTWKEEYSITLKKDDLYMSLWTYKYNTDKITVKLFGFGEKYSSKDWEETISSKEDLLDLVKSIKSFTQTAVKYKSNNDESDYSIMKNISNMYNLKLDPNYPNLISKTYRDQTKFYLKYYSTNKTISLRISSSPLNSVFGRYSYHSDDYEINDNPEEIIQKLLLSLKEEIQKDIENPTSYLRYDAPYALKFVDFLEKKVFVKRNG